jgi:hypothetical protein
MSIWIWSLCLVGLVVPAEPSRLLPASGLTFYLEYDGLSAHADAWKASAAREILVGKAAGSTMVGVERRMLDSLLKLGFSESQMTGDQLTALQDHLVGQGFAFATYEDDGESSTVFVLNGFNDKGGLDRFERLLRGLLQMEPNARFPDPARVRDRELRGYADWKNELPAPALVLNPFQALNAKQTPTGLTWWLEGDALIVVKGPNLNMLQAMMAQALNQGEKKDFRKLHQARVTSVLDAIEAKRPNVSTHPAYVASTAEGRDLRGFEPTGLFFAEAKQGEGVLGNLGGKLGASKEGGFDEFAIFEALDLNRANRIVCRWGFRGKSLLTDVRFEAPTRWEGLLGQFDLRGFAKGSIPPVPQGMGAFAVGPVTPSKALDAIGPLRQALKPEYLETLKLAEKMIGEATTPRRRADLLERLGPTWSVYASPARSGARPEEAQPTLLIGFDDPDKIDQALQALATEINADLSKRLGDRVDAKADGVEKPKLAIERLPAPDRGYRLVSSRGLLPRLSNDVQPTVLIGKSYLALAFNPAQAREAIAAESNPDRRWKPTGELARSFEALPTNVSFLSVGNPRDSSWPEAIVNLPSTAGSFLEKFLHVDLAAERPKDLLDALGVPRSVASPESRAGELRSLIHPSVVAALVEERSVRIVSLEALPLACLWFEAHFEPKGNMDVKLKFGPGN